MILCDNQSGIRLPENPVFHDRSKHIDIRYHFIWDMVQWGLVRLDHIGTDEQVVDILTMPLGKVMFLTFREKFEIVERPYFEGPAWVGLWALGDPRGLGIASWSYKHTCGYAWPTLLCFCPTDDIELVRLSLIYALHASCPWSFRLMGSTCHLANEVGNVDRDHSKTDGHIGYLRTLYV